MQHLIIYAHPSKKSFSCMLKDRLVKESLINGYKPIVRDLYQMSFNPVLSSDDLDKIKYGNVSDDIIIEQEYIVNSDLITLIFPLWWAGYPAILKGYIDRVMSYGFAYKAGEKGIEGLLINKKVVLLTSMGNSIEEYEGKNLIGAFKQTLGHEIFYFCGMDVIHHEFFQQIPDASEEIKEKYSNKALKFYNSVWFEKV
ncbi:MAG: NAD(P)H-dependent oxidoreductase [Marinilabiliaceae bacterium]|nr:NAD(P)H-dependent oxidoreductase [Marinilabiliaceae bacterium]